MRWFDGSGFSVIIQFKAKKKWMHGLLYDQNAEIVRDLQQIGTLDINGLSFRRFETTIPREDERLVFLHDSRAFNADWERGYDVSPFIIAPDCHDGKCFIELLFNARCYWREGNKTVLRDDWLTYACAVSEEIEREARHIFGLK